MDDSPSMSTRARDMPSIPLALGLGGLLPFVASAVATVILDGDGESLAAFVLGAYGAVILSFLGGVRWGVRVNDRKAVNELWPMLASVAPSLVAWPALLLGGRAMLALLLIGFLCQYAYDRQSAADGELPRWFGRLRLWLTSGAVLSLALGALAL